MMLRNFFAALLVCFSTCIVAQVPKLGTDNNLDIAAWNVEWFGYTSEGPTNEALQFTNVKELIIKTDFDIIAMEEMSDANAYFNLSDQLFSKYSTVISTFTATQKTCLYFKKDMFEYIQAETKNILTQYASGAFATRPPLQVALKTIGGNKTDTLYCIVVHLKAHTGTPTEKQESYDRRKEATDHLKTYIEQYMMGKKYIILGDWNDDLNVSIQNGQPTPFKQLLDANYFFATKQLTDVGKKSYAFGAKMIDHMMLGKTMESYYIAGSSRVFDNAGNYITNYANTTSDHYPIYAVFDWKKLAFNPVNPNTGVNEAENIPAISVFPNPATNTISFSGKLSSVIIYDMLGREKLSNDTPGKTMDISILENGVYSISIKTGEVNTIQKIVVSR